MPERIVKGLRLVGHRVIDRIWRLGSAARFFLYTLVLSGESFRRLHLTVREIYFTGVLSRSLSTEPATLIGRGHFLLPLGPDALTTELESGEIQFYLD